MNTDISKKFRIASIIATAGTFIFFLGDKINAFSPVNNGLPMILCYLLAFVKLMLLVLLPVGCFIFGAAHKPLNKKYNTFWLLAAIAGAVYAFFLFLNVLTFRLARFGVLVRLFMYFFEIAMLALIALAILMTLKPRGTVSKIFSFIAAGFLAIAVLIVFIMSIASLLNALGHGYAGGLFSFGSGFVDFAYFVLVLFFGSCIFDGCKNA